jgi:hypothetical protein
MANLYEKKLEKLNSLLGHLHDALVQAEELFTVEEREGDKAYALEVYGSLATELETHVEMVTNELDAVRAMVDLEGDGSAVSGDRAISKGDSVVYIADKSISGIVSSTYEKDGELYAYVDTGEVELPLKADSLQLA